VATNADKTVATGTASFTVTGGASEPVTALTIIPGSEALSLNGTGQLIALGTSGANGLQQIVTSSKQLSWGTSIPAIATVNASGLITGVSAGGTVITAIWSNPDGSVVAATPVTVTVTNTPAPEPLLSLTIIPSSITVGNINDTGNFLAIGTYSTAPQVRDLTNSVTWISSEPNVFPVNTNSNPTNQGAPGGIVTAYGTGGAVIIAEAKDPQTGSIQTATTTFNCPLILPNPPLTAGSCYPGSETPSLLSTITIYNEGLNMTNWVVTGPSATGTADVIHCGPGWAGTGGSVCVATYPVGTSVTLTAPAGAGAFGGWSDNCVAVGAITANGPNTCVVIAGEANPAYDPNATNPTALQLQPWLSSNVTVGAVFN
jgi:hypothetical protein